MNVKREAFFYSKYIPTVTVIKASKILHTRSYGF